MPSEWNPPDADDLVRRYQAGESARQLARIHNVDQATMRAFLRRQRVVTGHRKARATVEELEAYRAGESVLAISRRLGVSRQALTNRLRASQVDLRGTKGNGRNSLEARCRAALTKELRACMVGGHEDVLGELLKDLAPVRQRAVGPYNLDLAVLPVAVEVLGSDWCNAPEKVRMHGQRTKHLFDAGWNIVYVRVPARTLPPGPGAAQEIRAFVEESRGDPTFRRQHRVIRGDGSPTTLRLDLD